MAVVNLEHIWKRFGETVAVQDFNLETNDGEFVVLVGPSGCGKSTMLRMIAGLEEISEGRMTIEGREVQHMPPKDRDIAMVFQNYALYPHMNVFQNIAFTLELRGVRKAEIKTQVEEAARILGIEHLLQRKPRELSGGQRQRVALGRAIVRHPQVFLLDEPLSNLDAKLRVGMRAEIAKLHRRLGVTSFYVTHDQVEALTMGQRIVVMRDGQVQQTSTPLDLYDNPVNKFVAGFIGNPAMNFLTAHFEAEARRLSGESFSFEVAPRLSEALSPYTDQQVCVGVRPEHIQAVRDGSETRASTLKGTVELVEPLGSVTEIQVNVGGTLITAQVDRNINPRTDDSIELSVDPAHVHLFDMSSEESLLAQQAAA